MDIERFNEILREVYLRPVMEEMRRVADSASPEMLELVPALRRLREDSHQLSELAWAAGFFDGEGSVSRNRNQPVLVVGQTGTTEHLERFIKAVGIGRVLGPYAPSGFSSRPTYRWQVYGQKARLVMGLLRPYLCSPKVAKYDAWFGEEST